MSNKQLFEEALSFHAMGRKGKIEVTPIKALKTQKDLSLAYSPGVAAPCLEIEKNPKQVYEYTSKGNLVAVISNGSAVLGLGNIGALAGKPVMEGKSVLFKSFADVDAIDIEVDSQNIDEIVNCVKLIGQTFGGINLEDIKAPECFAIEQKLKEILPIPVFHDDQHGTAIVAAAGLINAIEITGRKISDVKMVVNGAGAAGIACVNLFKFLGVKDVILCDTKGVISTKRQENMNEFKKLHAADTDKTTLKEAVDGADVFVGLSVKGALTPEMVKSMAKNPIIFAMANPDPEVTPEEVAAIRDDAIMATGRSDYPNQVNNVLGFPYIFRGALDVRATTINEEMKVAAAYALAELAKSEVPEEVKKAYAGKNLSFGKEYIIPTPFDPRLIVKIPLAVAKAAISSGVALAPFADEQAYIKELSERL